MTGKTIDWFARNHVAANLLMALILVAGAITVVGLPLSKLNPNAPDIPPLVHQEIFPELSMDTITVTVPYLGAAPEEVEEGVCVRIEEEIQDLDGIKKIMSTASEGVGVVTVQLLAGTDAREVLNDVKARIDAIDTFPEETERPIIRELTNRMQVISVAVYGDTDQTSLRYLAEQTRDGLLALPGITLVELMNAPPFEISIEVSEDALRRHGLTFDAVARAVRRSSLDVPGGSVKTEGGEILLRTKGQAYRGREFEELVLISRPDGTHLTLGEVAVVVDDFEETDQLTQMDGKPAALIEIFRTGDQDALAIAAAARDYVRDAQPRLPAGITLATWRDGARLLEGRRDLLIRNGKWGLLLVAATLALFLQVRLAFWVSLGMAISFMGAISLMPALGMTFNMISLFAFILVLGIVVDDAIVVGENIYTHQHRTGKGLEGAIEGAQEVSLPVVFAVLTTVAAFSPLMAVQGAMGKIMATIPLIVIPCLLWSLIESMWILPSHLSHYRKKERLRTGWHVWNRFQGWFVEGLERFVERVYAPLLATCLRWRYLTLSIALAVLLLTAGLVGGGTVRFIFFPDVESDFVAAAVTLPQGSPLVSTSAAVEHLRSGAERLRAELIEETGQDPFLHLVASTGEQPFSRVQRQNAGGMAARVTGSHLGEITVELTPSEDRSVSSSEIAARWRDVTGSIPDALDVNFTASLFSPGEDINLQVTGPDLTELQEVTAEIETRLAGYAGVHDITNSFLPGKREVKLDILPAAEMLGLTLSDLANQVRQAFYGEEAQRVLRGRNEVRVMVRYPRADRESLGDLEQMRIRTPDGAEVPFSEVATVARGRGYSAIQRVDRRRAINVLADVDPAIAVAGDIVADLRSTVAPEILADHPALRFSFEGQQAEQRDTMQGLIRGFALALIAIFALLAIPLRSYSQPLLIMAAIPFGLVGAVWGHLVLGLDMTILSLFGLVALTGVVVNDSLVMVDFINRHRRGAGGRLEAIRRAGMARFRPILLTSLTTFVGLSPLMLERSMQARFLIPMAVSLAFGVMFATTITLILVPSGYMVLEDLTSRRHRAADSAALRGSERETVDGGKIAPSAVDSGYPSR